MLSLQQAIEIKESTLAYLKATFTFQDKTVHKAFYDFVNHPKDGLFKGPYLSIKLPFVKAKKEEKENIPLEIKPDWSAYDHQIKSWHRLSTQDQAPQPTIITTGTGSGKTESFMYPVIDYCYKKRDQNGIKVIILYPMNALATDQAKRLAEIIHEDERTRGLITAGLFIGEGKNVNKYPHSMGSENIIEKRDSILSSPPDILLTNFKMLDYALMKGEYNDLWKDNFDNPELFKFLVLDELHTYDGAQGTDVANLIRRLKLKIGTPKNHLCPVGTSATIGSGEDAPRLLSEYASKVFGEDIDESGIITENRLSLDQFFNKERKPYFPQEFALKNTQPITGEGYNNYIERQLMIWQVDESNLSDELLMLQIVHDLVAVVNSGKGIHSLLAIIQKLSDINDNYRDIPQWNSKHNFNPKEAIIFSLVALISEAKTVDPDNGRKTPFLFSQTSIWIRELSGVVRKMTDEPTFTWNDQVDEEQVLSLPPWFCRECGASGWLGVKHDNKERFEKEIDDVYKKFFSDSKNERKHIFFANKTDWFSQRDLQKTGYEPTDQFEKFVYNKNLEFYPKEDKERVKISAFKKIDSKGWNNHICPECNTKNTVSIIGTRAATLSSIGVSQVLSSDLDVLDQQQRKVLAFTNSVQDAAHQAGFVEARNYSFTFRSSLQKVINNLAKPTNLLELSHAFKSYWKEQADDSGTNSLKAYYYRFFPTDYLGKASPSDYEKNNQFENDFQSEFDTRMDWQVFSEFGYNAMIGRTLEKTGSSAVSFDSESIESTWSLIEPWLTNNDIDKAVTKESFVSFVVLILHRIRIRGAISHPYLSKYREENLSLWHLNWQEDSRHFLNKKFSPRSRIPKLLTNKPESRGLLDSTNARTTNWFHSYFTKSFLSNNGELILTSSYIDLINDFYSELIRCITETGLLQQKTTANDLSNYSLNPAKVWITNKVNKCVCDKCGHEVFNSDTNSHSVGGKCLNYRCVGDYELVQDVAEKTNYYQMVYNRERSPRIYAADHTGLLERKARENLEIDFKKRPKFNSKNAMVATSTLEMGIDIGTLNTVFNNSVPLLPSNYLQRVGRAGRYTGSALIVNYAQKKPHDLYYFEEPMEMMAGKVNTPGCYIEAKEILKRHFFAFCIDTWTLQDPLVNRIPSVIRYLKIETADLQSEDFFLNRLLNYVRGHEEQLLERFKLQYGEDVSASVFKELSILFKNEQFYDGYQLIFHKLKDEIWSIKTLISEVDKQINKKKLGKNDDEFKLLSGEKKNLNGIIAGIRKRAVMEHLTNVGALPNYAFPETGVVLNAKVLANRAESGIKPPLNKDFEIVRSSKQAIRELAPDNFFYSQGYRFQISGINAFDLTDKQNLHNKQFCSNCDHITHADIDNSRNCPKCGDESWGSPNNIHSFAKLTSVKSFNNKADAVLKDAKDERDNIIFNVQRHFKFEQDSSHGAWTMKDIPFGIEFVKNVTLTETNLGRGDAVSARKVKINNQEVPAHGFVTCKYCGKSSSNITERDYKYHYGFCKHKEVEYDGESNEVFDETYFFREVKTEALKILLPVQELNSEAEIKMFKAGIELGLKNYFQGNPQHLQILDYKEYNNSTLKFDRYLVLMDAIPGGTGYLEKLFDHKEFSKVLSLAYESIATCKCQNYGKDGCYHCVYTYSNQNDREDISRQRAEKNFEKIVKRSDGWENTSSGLGSITHTGQIEESELEERFIRSLSKFCGKEENSWSFESFNEDGIVNYSMSYQYEGKTISFQIRPQVDLGRNQGVKYHTRADFLIYCTELEGEDLPFTRDKVKKIAIYLDGYQYHASEAHNTFQKDFEKRQAINLNSEYTTWSLTWNDIENFDQIFLDTTDQNNREDNLALKLNEDGFKESKTRLINAKQTGQLDFFYSKNNMERLVEYLSSPVSYKLSWDQLKSMYLGFFQKQLFVPSYAPDQIDQALLTGNILDTERYVIQNKTLNALVLSTPVETNNLFNLSIVTNLVEAKVFARIDLLNTKNIDKTEWNQFWSIYNLLQSDLHIIQESEIDINELLEGFENSLYHPLLIRLHSAGKIKNVDDESKLTNIIADNGDDLAGAELIIHHKKIVIAPYEGQEYVFTEHGFEILNEVDLNNIEI